MEFKKGQKVRIKSWDKMAKEYSVDEYGHIALPNGYGFSNDMRHLCGRTATITEKAYENGWSDILLDFDNTEGNTYWVYTTDMVEPIDFTKADLKNGMILETREGEKFLYLNGFATNLDAWVGLDDFNNDLTCTFNKRFDIMRIFKIKRCDGCLYWIINTETQELVWERTEPKVKQVTKADAIKILKEKFSDFDEVEIV